MWVEVDWTSGGCRKEERRSRTFYIDLVMARHSRLPLCVWTRLFVTQAELDRARGTKARRCIACSETKTKTKGGTRWLTQYGTYGKGLNSTNPARTVDMSQSKFPDLWGRHC